MKKYNQLIQLKVKAISHIESYILSWLGYKQCMSQIVQNLINKSQP